MDTLKWLYNFLMLPAKLPYNYIEWEQLPFKQRAKKVCQAWALQGFGAPRFAYLFYVFKIAFYVWMWLEFCSYSTELGSFNSIGEWWFKIEALGKAIFWTCLLEVIGFGGACGPLGARYVPPLGGITYFLRPGTIKLPAFPKLISNDKRNWFDILLYLALLFCLVRVCVADAITPQLVMPVIILLPVIGLFDRQIYLAARADMWYPAMFVFLFPGDTAAALKILWIAVWLWAAFSKLQPSFSSVVSVMICNSPVFNFKWLKKRLFKNYPGDLRPASGTNLIAHFGTVIEFTLPLFILYGSITGISVDIMFYALCGMMLFHTFIFINFPMAVPMEWNVIMVYGSWVLFYANPNNMPFTIEQPLISLLFTVLLLVLPLLGNFFPRYVSFLLSMRYYAGTWPYNLWLFKKGTKLEKLEPNIVKTSPDLRKQVAPFYDEVTTKGILSRVIGFRLMHLPGRLLNQLLPKAVSNIDDYYWQDGEIIAAEVGGWNFGDGHLSSETLLKSVQKRCAFESGELRVIMVESPQLHNGKLHWRIYDAKDGLLEEGYGKIRELKELKPWEAENI